MERIVSRENKKVREWYSLRLKKRRDETGLFLIEGRHLIEEALKAGVVQTILYAEETCPFDFADTVPVSESVMEKLSANPSSASLIAVCRQTEKYPVHAERVLILDGIQDPGNLGTLIRTAVSFSFDAVYCSEACADLYNDKTIRSTQGALFHIPVLRRNLEDTVKALQAEGFFVAATALDSSVPMKEIEACEKMAFILGNEGQGVRRELIEAADRSLRIEMNGFESLNVAVAGGIIMYHYRKQ